MILHACPITDEMRQADGYETQSHNQFQGPHSVVSLIILIIRYMHEAIVLH